MWPVAWREKQLLSKYLARVRLGHGLSHDEGRGICGYKADMFSANTIYGGIYDGVLFEIILEIKEPRCGGGVPPLLRGDVSATSCFDLLAHPCSQFAQQKHASRRFESSLAAR